MLQPALDETALGHRRTRLDAGRVAFLAAFRKPRTELRSSAARLTSGLCLALSSRQLSANPLPVLNCCRCSGQTKGWSMRPSDTLADPLVRESISATLRRMGLLSNAQPFACVSLPGGVSSDIWRITVG